MSTNDIIFHLLDIQARDICIEAEDTETYQVTYESDSDNSDDEYKTKKQQKKKNALNTQQRHFVIHLFGNDEFGKPIRCDVTGFRPTLYIRLPEEKTAQSADVIKQYIKDYIRASNEINFKRITSKIFYGFTAGTSYPFLQVDVPSLALFRNIRNLFLDENLNPKTKKSLDGPLRGKTVEIFEANFDPMLRFIHTQNIQPCGWVLVKNGKSSIVSDNTTSDIIPVSSNTINYEHELVIECDYEDILPTKGPRVSAPFLTASWDIECFSMTGDFPLAKRTWKKTSKDIMHNARDASHAAELILNSLSITQNPVDTLPYGMTPIYCQLKRPISEISTKLLSPVVQELIDEALDKNNGDMEFRIGALEKTLEKTLKNLIYLVGDPVIQIGTTLTRGTPETTERHLFVFPDCAPITNIQIHSYKTEKAMIHGWFEWIIRQNPDILIGYNIFGFDELYLWQRAEELGLTTSNSIIHPFTRLFSLGTELKLEEKFLSSSAMGDNFLYIWNTHGRLQIDLFHYIKRNNVLPSYKLDEVTKHFMSGKIKSFTYDNNILTLNVAGAIKDVKVGRAITLLDETGESVTPKLTVQSVEGNSIIFNCELDEDVLNDLNDATKWVIVKDDVSPQDIFRLHRESSEGRAIVGKYCLQDCDLVIDLYRKLETFNNTMSMANVCSVPLSYIFTRGQGIKIESLIFKACRERNILIPVLPVPKQSSSDDSYEGAIVLDPEPGFYCTSPIGVCDFASLYPSTIVSENISHDSLLWIKDFNDDGSLIAHNWGAEIYDNCDGYAYTDIEYDIWRPDPTDTRKYPRKIRCGRRICRYAQPLDGTKSTLPQITTWLLSAREAKKKEMKAEKDPERYALLDAEQLAYKLTGNSLYGQLGSGTFKIRLQALAASVTAYGRKQIMFAKEAIEIFYGPGANNPKCAAKCMAKVVYGDSVTGDTPLLIKKNNQYMITSIQDLYSSASGFIHHDTKEAIVLKDEQIWTESGWTPIKLVIRHKLMQNKKLFRITTESGEVDVTEDHSLLLANGAEIKPSDVTVGTELLHSMPVITSNTSTFIINSYGSKCREYLSLLSSGKNKYTGNRIISIKELPHCDNTFVYDLETENHHFGVGPGTLVVHNTDSLFVEFNVKNPETGELLQGREARQATIDITDEAGHFITKVLKAPHDFEFDKAFDPMLLFSKKRYAGNMYENNADDYVHKYMGIALKRRDNAPIVKTIFGGAMKMLLNSRDVMGAFQFVKDKCMELVEGKVSLGQLTVTKSLRADYADPSRIAHKALADRISARDPGNAPAAGDRIGYIYICPKSGQEASKLQGDRIETPQYIKENNLKPDYRHYIEHQLQNPISQAFGLLLEKIPGFKPEHLKGCPSINENLDKYLLFREAKAAELLFSDCLRRHDNSSKKTAFMNMFGGKATITPSNTIHTTNIISKSASSTTLPSIISISEDSSRSTKSENQVQLTMSNFILDSYLMKQVDKSKKKKTDSKSDLKTDEVNTGNSSKNRKTKK
jgi:DNA polymerase elongation subunit (family B)